MVRVPDLSYDPNKKTSTPVVGGDRQRTDGLPNVPLTDRNIYEFKIQFMWLPMRASERLEARKAQQSPSTAAPDEVAGG